MNQNAANFWFGIEPTPKDRPRMTRRGHVFTTKKTRDFESSIKNLAHKQMIGRPLIGPIKVDIVFCITRRKSVKRPRPSAKPDIDNLAKSVLDGMEGIAFENDSQIVDLRLRKFYTDKGAESGIEVSCEACG